MIVFSDSDEELLEKTVISMNRLDSLVSSGSYVVPHENLQSPPLSFSLNGGSWSIQSNNTLNGNNNDNISLTKSITDQQQQQQQQQQQEQKSTKQQSTKEKEHGLKISLPSILHRSKNKKTFKSQPSLTTNSTTTTTTTMTNNDYHQQHVNTPPSTPPPLLSTSTSPLSPSNSYGIIANDSTGNTKKPKKHKGWFEEEINDHHHFDIDISPHKTVYMPGDTLDVRVYVKVKKLQFLKATFEGISNCKNVHSVESNLEDNNNSNNSNNNNNIQTQPQQQQQQENMNSSTFEDTDEIISIDNSVTTINSSSPYNQNQVMVMDYHLFPYQSTLNNQMVIDDSTHHEHQDNINNNNNNHNENHHHHHHHHQHQIEPNETIVTKPRSRNSLPPPITTKLTKATINQQHHPFFIQSNENRLSGGGGLDGKNPLSQTSTFQIDNTIQEDKEEHDQDLLNNLQRSPSSSSSSNSSFMRRSVSSNGIYKSTAGAAKLYYTNDSDEYYDDDIYEQNLSNYLEPIADSDSLPSLSPASSNANLNQLEQLSLDNNNGNSNNDKQIQNQQLLSIQQPPSLSSSSSSINSPPTQPHHHQNNNNNVLSSSSSSVSTNNSSQIRIKSSYNNLTVPPQPPLLQNCCEHYQLISNRKHRFHFKIVIPSNLPPSFTFKKENKNGIFYRLHFSGLGELHHKVFNTDGPLIKGIEASIPINIWNPSTVYLPRHLISEDGLFGPSESFQSNNQQPQQQLGKPIKQQQQQKAVLYSLKANLLIQNFGIIGSSVPILLTIKNDSNHLVKGFKVELINRQQSGRRLTSNRESGGYEIHSTGNQILKSITFKSTEYHIQANSKYRTNLCIDLPSNLLPSVYVDNLSNTYSLKIRLRKMNHYVEIPLLILPCSPSNHSFPY